MKAGLVIVFQFEFGQFVTWRAYGCKRDLVMLLAPSAFICGPLSLGRLAIVHSLAPCQRDSLGNAQENAKSLDQAFGLRQVLSDRVG
jgi:hypothetical protein